MDIHLLNALGINSESRAGYLVVKNVEEQLDKKRTRPTSAFTS